jgi:hypothetical protein
MVACYIGGVVLAWRLGAELVVGARLLGNFLALATKGERLT